ncbi:HoxN/HupN/NixA family nickel/cobalt transporter [Vibrio superstes]|uniref:Nickel/cobalt efflux system n=1 Tax=Vibrio superstes NBRC 103154 TaxID=1219062 RepID=A0A511QMY6_9VIBR|nr:nickel transporter [Vibrio superstes]GEM78685.1 nickel/cobalt efflux system [Vibrio superstes NBRC 103154]
MSSRFLKWLIGATLIVLAYFIWLYLPQIWLQISKIQKYLVDEISHNLFYAGQGQLIYIGAMLFSSFLYGLIHSVAPGHGKTMIISISLVNGYSIRTSLKLVLLVAVLQATSACILVFGATYISSLLSVSLADNVRWLTQMSAIIIILLSLKLLLGSFIGQQKHASASGSWQPLLFVGLRPCTGAILVLFFANAFQFFTLGIVSTYAMALGTALTNSILVYKGLLAKRLTHEKGDQGPLSRITMTVLSLSLLLSGVVLFKLAEVSTLNLVH